MGDKEVCFYSKLNPLDFDIFKKEGLNIEDCCKCNGVGLDPLCDYREMVSEEFKNKKIYEQRYLYHHFGVLIPVRL